MKNKLSRTHDNMHEDEKDDNANLDLASSSEARKQIKGLDVGRVTIVKNEEVLLGSPLLRPRSHSPLVHVQVQVRGDNNESNYDEGRGGNGDRALLHCRTCRCHNRRKSSQCLPKLLCCCSAHDREYNRATVNVIMEGDEEKKEKKKSTSRWLTGPPSASKNPFKNKKEPGEFSIKKSLSTSAVSRSLKKSVSSSSLGKSLKRAASKLSLSSKEKHGGSVISVKTQTDLMPPPSKMIASSMKSTSTSSIGSEIGDAVKVRFIWDHGGSIVYVCVMQNGIKKSYRLLKENQGFHSSIATLWSGRAEFR